MLVAAAFYFGVVFATGFVLGAVRVTWIVPRLGERWAELLELPLMAVASALGAHETVRRFRLAGERGRAVAVGLLALACLIAAELGVVLATSDRSLPEYVASRDPVSGSVYLALLVVFAGLPAAFTRRRAPLDG
ncbi:MAG: hypothetical protein IT453_19660 [Planctomycetes bacterium]|nr:hypothetical protein [Planctomycetota bacterium]